MKTSPIKSQITSLIKLLDDRDEYVRAQVREELLKIGEEALPFLEMVINNEDNPAARKAAEEVVLAIYPRQLGEKFRRLQQSTPPGQDIDLETGVYLLMNYGYPEADPEECKKILDGLAEELAPRIPPDPSPVKVVNLLSHFLFQEKRFTGNEQNYFDPDNSYFNKVLSEKKGIPITLSVLCILIAERLKLPIVGIGMPCHFIVKYTTARDFTYFDPFNRGRILTSEDCVRIVNGFGFEFEDRFLLQVSNREILIRMIHNLIMIYNRTHQTEKIEHLKSYVNKLMDLP